MKNIFDVLRQKEAELQQIQKEIEALRIAARILSDEGEPRLEPAIRSGAMPAGPVAAPRPKDGPFDATPRQFP